VESLREKSDNITLVIDRSPFDRERGEYQESNLILQESDQALLSDMSSLLPKARKIQIVFSSSDGGIARIKLTERRWEIWVDTPGVRTAISEFNDHIHEKSKGRLVTPDFAYAAATLPFFVLFFFVIVIAGMNGNSTSGTKVKSGSPDVNVVVFPYWSVVIVLALVAIWVLFIALALGIGILRILGGGMRVWPKYLSGDSLKYSFYRLGVNPLNRGSVRTIITSILSSVLTAVLLFFLLGKR